MTDISGLLALRERVVAAGRAGTPLRLRGGGTKDFYGQDLKGEVLDTRGWRGIVSFEPTELVITARAGTPLAELEEAVSAAGQMLAFEPPAFGEGATIGGVVAAGLSGPRRLAAGAVRDFVLGAALLNARGEELHFGGQVMKNVAGYDVSRVLAGSLGTLGLITQVSLKVLPRPACEVSVTCEADQARALELVNVWGGQPLPLVSTAWHAGHLTLRLAGARAAVEAAVQKLSGAQGARAIDADEARAFWADLREQRHAFFSGAQPLWRLSLPSTADVLTVGGDTLVEWGGALRWVRHAGDPQALRAAVRAAGGSATLFRGGDKSVGVFDVPSAPLMAIHHRLKREFDPQGLFNPDRLYAGLGHTTAGAH